MKNLPNHDEEIKQEEITQAPIQDKGHLILYSDLLSLLLAFFIVLFAMSHIK